MARQGRWREPAAVGQHFETFQQVYDERFAARYGGVPARGSRPIVEQSVRAFLKCGDLHKGLARVRCPDCHAGIERLVGYMTRCPFRLSRLVR